MNRSNRTYVNEIIGCAVPDIFAFKDEGQSSAQPEIVDRLIRYYHVQKGAFSAAGLNTNDDMWRTIAVSYRDFEAALETRDAPAVSDMLLNVCRGPLVLGFMPAYTELVASHQKRLVEASHIVDKLLALGQALGCCTVQCPEQGQWGYPDLDPLTIIDEVQSRLPMDMRPPAAGGGSFGIRTDRGVLCLKDLFALYTAWRACDLLQDARDRIVCEIGGGTGTLAYYLAQARIREIWVYDLPIVSLVQGYYTMRSLGPDRVWLYGEAPSSATVRILPYWEFEHAPPKYFSLIVNQDSLPEIEATAADQYIRLIREKGRGVFLSINQEARAANVGPRVSGSLPIHTTAGKLQSVVHELIARNGGFRRTSRFPHWMRAGYVEELYEIQ